MPDIFGISQAPRSEKAGKTLMVFLHLSFKPQKCLVSSEKTGMSSLHISPVSGSQKEWGYELKMSHGWTSKPRATEYTY